jgi:hypothetical protein
VMVDDMADQLTSVQFSMNELAIPFFGFRYNRLDSNVDTFDSMVGNLQLKALLTQGYIPTDEQALQWKAEILEQAPHVSPDFYMNDLISGIVERAEAQKKQNSGKKPVIPAHKYH